MLDRCARRAPLLAASFASVLLASGCGGGEKTPADRTPAKSKKAPKDEAKEPTKVDGKAAPEQLEPSDSKEPATDAGAEKPAAEGGVAAEGGEAEGGAAAEGGEAEGGEAEGGEAEEGGEAGGSDSGSLLKEARTTKTTDERAIEALAEAEKAGATVKELARAAKARGDYLYKSPERAKVFYEWSAEKDETYADPVFRLAKQKAVTGDVDDVVKLLKQVAERKGGKKLLQQIDFDPTWDIVKDDPEVRALL